MSSIFRRSLTTLLGGLALFTLQACDSAGAKPTLPDPAVNEAPSPHAALQTAVLAGGCFWGMEEVFQHVKGVTAVVAGYSGGAADTAHYDMVSNGNTGHAESVKITYDPAKITYGQLLKVYFSVAHNPTELNYQGPDHGTQYRSTIFTANPEQEHIAQAYIQQLQTGRVFSRPIITTTTRLQKFYPAEAYHQDYAMRHPHDPYIMIYDLPKLTALRQQFPDLYRGS